MYYAKGSNCKKTRKFVKTLSFVVLISKVLYSLFALYFLFYEFDGGR